MTRSAARMTRRCRMQRAFLYFIQFVRAYISSAWPFMTSRAPWRGHEQQAAPSRARLYNALFLLLSITPPTLCYLVTPAVERTGVNNGARREDGGATVVHDVA